MKMMMIDHLLANPPVPLDLAQELAATYASRYDNRRGAMVTDRYQHIKHHPTVEDFVAWARTANDGKALPIIAIDNVPGCQQLESYQMPKNCVLLFGQEGPGLSGAAIEAATDVVEITQYGSTRSINASAAAAITMHAWITQHKFGS
jgi:tRNA G18 (ribose-2'-O)-methylase SpoU